MNESTSFLVFTNVFLYFLLFLVAWGGLKHKLSSSITKLSWLLCLAFCIFAYWGSDWFHYSQDYNEILQGGETNLETIYVWFIKTYHPGYILFRLMVWGSALYCLYKTIKILSIKQSIFIFFFSTIALIWFSYARASLAMSIAFLALALISTPRFKKARAIGYLLLLSSVFFHKTGVFAIIAVLLSQIMLHASKKMLYLLFLSFPIITYVVITYFEPFFNSMLISDFGTISQYANAGSSYFWDDSGILMQSGIGKRISDILEKFTYYMMAITSTIFLIKKEKSIPNEIKAFILCSLIIVVISSSFYFGQNTMVLYGRFLRFSFIPSCVCLTYLSENFHKNKLIKYTYTIAIISSIYALLYSFYNTF